MVAKPVNSHGKGGLKKHLQKYLLYAKMRPGCSAILVLLDADDDCPEALALDLAAQARSLNIPVPIAIVVANHKYEAWFLASLPTIKGSFNIPQSAQFTGNPEGVADPKHWLTEAMPNGRAYKETADQAPMTAAMDLNIAGTSCRSLRRMSHAIRQLKQFTHRNATTVTP
jgi:hypothetical protein